MLKALFTTFQKIFEPNFVFSHIQVSRLFVKRSNFNYYNYHKTCYLALGNNVEINSINKNVFLILIYITTCMEKIWEKSHL